MKRRPSRKPRKRPVPPDPDQLPTFKDGREFDALSAADKEKIWQYYNRIIPLSETREPTPSERARIKRIRAAFRRQS